MNDDVVEKPGTAASRPVWVWPTGFAVLLLTAWVLAGCFMEGEDELQHVVPWLVVLGGGVAGERLDLACQLYSQGHGYRGVVLTGGSARRIARDWAALVSRCGVPSALLHNWPTAANSFEAVGGGKHAVGQSGHAAFVVSDSTDFQEFQRNALAVAGRVTVTALSRL
jgi:hypothetical protein